MSGPQPATAADELLVAQLPDDVREALRRLAAADVLNEALDAYPEHCECECGGGVFGSGEADEYSDDDMAEAFRLGWIRAGAIGPAEPSLATARRQLRSAGLL